MLSVFGFGEVPGPVHLIDGIPHCIPPAGGERLGRLSERFELVWATGWEEKANEYLPHLLDLPFRELPYLTFDGDAVFGTAHWKVDAIVDYADGRPLAWIDDSLDDECREWARARKAPTLLIETDSAVGITDAHVERLLAWAGPS